MFVNFNKSDGASDKHYNKYRHSTEFPGMEILWKGSFRIVSGDSPKTMRKLCLSTKFPHQEIRWNDGIFHRERSDDFYFYQ